MLQLVKQNEIIDVDHLDTIDQRLLHDIAQNRSAQALEHLYRRYRPRLIGFLRRMTRDDALIEEAYNDIMLKVWDKAGQYKSRSKASSWIFSIAYRICLRMIKKQNLRTKVYEVFGQEAKLNDSAVSDTSVEDQEQIGLAMESLSAEHRLVIELSYFLGHSTEEISVIANCPVNTVKTRLFYARKKLRVNIEGENSQEN